MAKIRYIGRFGAVAARIMLGLFLAIGAVIGSAGVAQAQVDWLVQIDDAGFDPFPAGGTIEYHVKVSNNGFSAAPATTFNLTVPAGMTVLSSSGDLTGCAPLPATNTTLTCNVPPLAPLGEALLDLIIDAPSAGFYSFLASVPTAGDIDSGNNSNPQATTITNGSDISLALTMPSTAASGSIVPLVWRATNNGPNIATAMDVTFAIPTGLVITSAPGGCTLASNVYTCAVGSLGVGAFADLTFQGQISAGGGSTVTAAASVVNIAPGDPDVSDNTDTGSISTTAGTDLAVSKTRTPGGGLIVGNSVSWTISSRYTGDSPSGITITDTIPANYSITSVTPALGSGWACAVSGQDISCTKASGSVAGAAINLGDIVVAATTTSPGSPVNTATIGAASPGETIFGNNTASDGGVTISAPTADLAAIKTGPYRGTTTTQQANPSVVTVGGSYVYGIRTGNNGNADFTGTVVMTDTIPAGLTVTAYSGSGWTCVQDIPGGAALVLPFSGPQAVACTFDYVVGDELSPGDTTPTATFTATVTQTGTLTNAMTVTTINPNVADPIPGNNSTTFVVQSSADGTQADLSVLKRTTVATPLPAGDTRIFELEVVNAGPGTASTVVLADNFVQLINGNQGAAAGFVSATVSPGIAAGFDASDCVNVSSGARSRQLTCTIPSLPICTAGADCPIVTVTVRPGGNAGTRTNTATAFSNITPDPVYSDNSGSVSFGIVARADVTVVKSATPDPVGSGQPLTYIITASNIDLGLSAAANVTIDDTLPADMYFVSATPSSGSCTAPAAGSVTGAAANNHVVCNLGTINSGAQRTVTVVVRPTYTTRGTTISNSVAVSTTTIETNYTNNTASADVGVSAPDLDILVNKVDTIDPVAVGQMTEYVITVSNAGPSAGHNIIVTDDLPTARLSFQSVTIPSGRGSCSTVPAVGSIGGQLICEFPYLLPGAGNAETIRVMMQGATKGSIINNVSINSDEIAAGLGYDRISGNNQTTENTTVRTRADIEMVSKTPSSPTVALFEDFTYTALVRVNTTIGLAEADDVTVTDTLPANMELTGTPTVTVLTGSASTTTCAAAINNLSFTCSLGTVALGSDVEILIPVQVIGIAASPQSFTNTASVTTSSLDVTPGNNSASGDVSVTGASLAGTVFRDFADDTDLTAGDTGIGGVLMTLTGVTVDGGAVTRTTTTAPDGTYRFDLLAQGTYTVTRAPVSEPLLVQGTNSVGQTTLGTFSGALSGTNAITTIALPANTDAFDYDFAFIPLAGVGIAKSLVATSAMAADGSFIADFQLIVENLSIEGLTNVVVTDLLSGASPLFGNLISLADPVNDPMTSGSYAITAAPTGTCGGTVAGFNGATTPAVAENFTLASGATCTLSYAIRVRPTSPFPVTLPSGGNYDNQAVVTAQGALSGQTSLTNPALRDLSDDGTVIDANGDGIAGGAGEDDPTPVAITVPVASIALIKTADGSRISDPARRDDILVYRFEVTNTGPLTLSNVFVTDPLAGITLLGGPITLLPGETNSIDLRAEYPLTQANVDAGFVENQATAHGTDPFGTDVDDLSGTTIVDDSMLVTPLVDVPGVALVKLADASGLGSPPQAGDVIRYSFSVENTGNVTLTNVTVTDPLPGLVMSGTPILSMAPGDINDTAFTATYELTYDDIIAGNVTNLATVTGTPPTGPDVDDFSGDDVLNDLPTIVPVTTSASIALEKFVDTSALTDGAAVGELLDYTFTVTNTGNLPLAGITITDALPGVVVSGGPIDLLPGQADTTSFTATYPVRAEDIEIGEVINTATTSGYWGDNPANTVDAAASVAAPVGTIEAVSEVFPPFTGNGGTTTCMLASDLLNGDPATLETVTIRIISIDDGLTLDTATCLITLAPGYPAGSYQVEYEIASIAAPSLTDTAIETVVQGALPAIETTKTQTLADNGDGRDSAGDRVVYTITVTNTGNIALADLGLVDRLTDLDDGALSLDSGPTFVSASAGSAEGDLQIGEIATYTGEFIVNLQAINAGGISNTVTATAAPVYPPDIPLGVTTVSDISDDGDNTDGDSTGDPTELVFATGIAAGALEITKTTPRDIVERGAVVPYTITLTNESGSVIGPVRIVDTLPDGFVYVDGTAMIGGVAATITVDGGRIIWNDLLVPAEGEIVATLSARILSGADAGDHVNAASAYDPADGTLVVGPATATVQILPEAVFDCGEVIGRVFTDLDGDGYQDDPGGAVPDVPLLPSGITDQSYDGAKADPIVPSATPGTETGIPGVRLATVDGLVITTDENGLFSVPCAMLPADAGSNFILKLDDRSLPAGYRLTTENPRVVRLTPGMLTEMNFGAAIGRVIRVDLTGAAFFADASGAVQMQPSLLAGIEELLAAIGDDPTNVRLAFHVPADADSGAVGQARGLMDMVETRIDSRWREIGGRTIRIEQIIVRAD